MRRDANKEADGLKTSKELSEDDADRLKGEIDELTKSYTSKIDAALDGKTKELMEV